MLSIVLKGVEAQILYNFTGSFRFKKRMREGDRMSSNHPDLAYV